MVTITCFAHEHMSIKGETLGGGGEWGEYTNTYKPITHPLVLAPCLLAPVSHQKVQKTRSIEILKSHMKGMGKTNAGLMTQLLSVAMVECSFCLAGTEKRG